MGKMPELLAGECSRYQQPLSVQNCQTLSADLFFPLSSHPPSLKRNCRNRWAFVLRVHRLCVCVCVCACVCLLACVRAHTHIHTRKKTEMSLVLQFSCRSVKSTSRQYPAKPYIETISSQTALRQFPAKCCSELVYNQSALFKTVTNHTQHAVVTQTKLCVQIVVPPNSAAVHVSHTVKMWTKFYTS